MPTDLTSLMQVAPGTASFMLGQNNADDRAMQALKMLELKELMKQRQAQEMRTAEMAPLELDAKRLANQKGQAELPGIMAQSEGQQLDTGKKRATQDAAIASTNYEAKNKIFRSAISQIGALADAVESSPGIERHSRLRSGIERLGMGGSDADKLMEHFSKFSAEQLPKEMKRIAQALAQNDPQYIREMDKQRLADEGATKRTAMQIGSQERMENNRIAAGKYNRGKTAMGVEESIRRYAGNAARAAEILESAAFEAAANNDLQAARDYATRAKNARARAAEDARNRGAARPEVDIGQLGMGTTAPPSADAPIGPGGEPPQPSPQPKPKSHTLADVSKMYPGIPPEKLKEAYKKKFGVDLK